MENKMKAFNDFWRGYFGLYAETEAAAIGAFFSFMTSIVLGAALVGCMAALIGMLTHG